MPNHWKFLRSMISTADLRSELFLSLINEQGEILCANATMQRNLDLENPRSHSINFFHLLHPEHSTDFREAVLRARATNKPTTTELYLKNGYYHPMKWQISHVEDGNSGLSGYFCIGYKLVDDERMQQFNKVGASNYQLIVEGLNAGILFQDERGELIAANRKAAEIYDTTLERLYQLRNIGDTWDTSWKIFTEDGKPVRFSETPFMKAIATGQSFSETLVVQLASAEKRHILFHSQPLLDECTKKPISVVTSIEDVTWERLLSGFARDNETLFHSFLEKTPALAWVLDEKARLLFASRSFYDYFGLKPELSVNRHIVDLVPATVSEALYSKHMQVLDTGRSIDVTEKVKWADGTNFVFQIHLFPIAGANNRILVGGQAVNLADKYAAEKKLREANERLLLLTRATNDAIWEWDMQTGQIFRNEALMNMIGFHADDSKGLTWWLRRIHPEDRNRVTDKIKDTTDKGQQSWEDEYRFRCSDGEYKNITDRGFVVYENGLPVKMIGSLQDVTEIRKLEDQLVQEKLQRQKEISETVIRAQEKERTRIGHELHDNVNQILSTTRMFVDMLKPASEEEQKIKEKSIEYLITAIEEIRKLSRELVVPQFREKGLIDSIYSMAEDIQMSSSLRIRFVHDNDANLLSPGKKITIFRIVQEQLKNILKYSQATQVDIVLQCRNENLQLIIKDDGVGFDPKQSHRGIGLSNIHDRTAYYNGSVDIQSAVGQGCTLTVQLPVLD